MQIYGLSIYGKKCLSDFHISFYNSNSNPTTILIGENGAGKSTMLEAILEIFASFDSPTIEKNINYSYDIEYQYAQKQVFIQKKEREYRVVVDGIDFGGSYEQVRPMMHDHRLFPKRIISFYSGANNKLETLIQKLNTEYKKQYRQIMRGYFYVLDNVSYYDPPKIPVRKYNFCDEHMVPIYLCSILAGHESFEKQYLQEECHLGELHRVSMIVDLNKVERLFGGRRFEGEYPHKLMSVAEFIDQNLCEYLRAGFRFVSSGKGFFELGNLCDCEADSVSILEFFEILHDMFEVQYEVYAEVNGSVVKTEELSEGQRQLIKVLGMLGICKKEDCLILLDEPDAHMNPQWKYGIKKIMDGCLQAATNAQAIIATHDPLVINGVDKNFIRIFDMVEGKSVVRVPTEDAVGMGIDGLLQSQYYGLETTLDIETQELLEEKRNLMVKRKREQLSNAEQLRLRSLTEMFEDMAFTRNVPTDNYYDDFVVAVHEIYKNRPAINLTPAEIEEKNRILREITEDLIGI